MSLLGAGEGLRAGRDRPGDKGRAPGGLEQLWSQQRERRGGGTLQENLKGPQSLAPGPRTPPGKRGEEAGKVFSAMGVLKALTQDEMCSCLGRTPFPPKRSCCGLRVPHGREGSMCLCSLFTCWGSERGLDWFLGPRRGKNNKEWKKTPPNRDLAPAGMMSSGKCEQHVRPGPSRGARGVLWVGSCEKGNRPCGETLGTGLKCRSLQGPGGRCVRAAWAVSFHRSVFCLPSKFMGK